MKFSIFIEVQMADGTRTMEAQTFRDCVEQVVLADQLGYHCVWEVEHHGLYEYSHSSAPETLLAFCAARTKNIRLGHGINLLPFRYNHPIRVAERVATLDILSEGRVNFGTGKSASLVEQMAFQCDLKTLQDEWLEALQIIPKMWNSDVFSYEGRFFNIPPTKIIPRPVQRPHPPLFASATQPQGMAHIGRLGLGVLNFAGGSDKYLNEKVAEYRKAIQAAEPIGKKNNHFACTPSALILENDLQACRYGLRGARFFRQSLQMYYAPGTRHVGPLGITREFPTDPEIEEYRQARGSSSAPLANIIGDPVSARETVSRFKEAGVDELILVMQMGTVPHHLIMKSLRTFGERVMPHFA